jgi:DNA primase
MPGLIPQQFIDGLLSQVDIIDVVGKRISLKKAGQNYVACCPFHKEKTPSFNVNFEKQFYHCFGCGVSGNAIGFVMAHDGLGFPDAVENLAASVGLTVPSEKIGREQVEKLSRQKELSAVMSQAAIYFTQQLDQCKKAGDYLAKRGIGTDVIERFQLGYAPAGWSGLSDYLVRSGWEKAVLVESGLSVENKERHSLYDRFRDRVIFPIRDAKGQVIAFGGRVMGNEKPKYLNSPETPLFTKGQELYGLYDACRAQNKPDRLLIVEGYMDVVSLSQSGIDYAVAALGTALTTRQIEKAFKKVNQIIFCFDGDEAGRKAGAKTIDASLPLLSDGRTAKFVFLAEGQDPDSYIRRRGPKDFNALIDSAQNFSAFLFDCFIGDLPVDTAEGRATVVSKILPRIQKIPAGFFRNQMISELALRAKTSVEALHRCEGMSANIGQYEPDAVVVHSGHSGLNSMDCSELADSALVASAQLQSGVLYGSTLELESLDVLGCSLLLTYPWLAACLEADQVRLALLSESQPSLRLMRLFKAIQDNPSSSSGRLLGLLWADIDQREDEKDWWQSVSKLGGSEESPDLVENTFSGIIFRLAELKGRLLPLDALIAASAQRVLSDEEKQRLKQLLAP